MPASTSHKSILAEPGELVIPRQLAADLIPQLQKALAKTNDDMEKFPGINGLDFRQFMVGNAEAKVDPETGMEMFPLGRSFGGPTTGPASTGGRFSGTAQSFSEPERDSGFEQNVKAAAPSVNVQPFAGTDPEAGLEKLLGYGKIGGSFQDVGFGGTDPSLVTPDDEGILGGLFGKAFPDVERRVAVGGLPGFSQNPAGDVEFSPLGTPTQVTLQGSQGSQGFNRPDLLEAPGNFGFSGLDELQQRSRIATEGLFGNSLFRGDEAQNVFKNLLHRSLIGPGGQLGDVNSLLPVEKDYITQVLGLDISNLESLLGALR